MLAYNEVKEKKFIELDGAPYEVLTSHVFRKQQRKPVNNCKLKNLITGKVTERSFHVSETIPEADISLSEVKFLYSNRGEFWFANPNNPSDRFKIPEDTIGEQSRFLKANAIIEGIMFKDGIIGVKFPIKVELKVKEAPPATRGNTAQGGNKQVVLETGATLNVPLFIDEGDILRINTETGEYVERVTVGGSSF
jgi:elongation factor P